MGRGARAGGNRSVFGLVVTLLAVGALGGLIGLSLVAARAASPATASIAVGIAHTVIVVGWTTIPVLTLGTEGTLDPSRLALFPLRARDLMPGLMLARLAGAGGLFTAEVLVGGFVAQARSPETALAALLAAGLVLVLSLAASGAVTSALAGAAQKRRWRDVVLFAGPAFAIATNVGVRFIGEDVFGRVSGRRAALRRVLDLLPPAWPARAVQSIGEGHLAVAGAVLVALAVVGWALVRLWQNLLEGALVEVSETRMEGGKRAPLLLPGFSRLRDQRMAAVASRELRLSWRDPRQRAALLGSSAPAFVMLAQGFSGTNPIPLELVALMTLMPLAAQASNLFGFDGPAYWMHAAAGEEVRTDLVAKGAVKVAMAVTLAAALVTVLALRSGSWAGGRIAVALAMTFAGGCVLAGVGSWFSVTSPVPMVDRRDPFSSGNSGRSSGSLLTFVAMMATPALVLGVSLALYSVLDGHPVLRGAVLALMVTAGLVIWQAGLAAAERADRGRDPDLLGRLTLSVGD
jgi:ABC-2 type transport system permease protein